MVSLVPPEAIEILEQRFGNRVKRLGPLELQAMATAAIESRVSNRRMQQLSDEHPTDLTRMLQGLRGKGLLRQIGQTRGATYELGGRRLGVEAGLPHLGRDSLHKAESPRKAKIRSPHTVGDIPEDELQNLREIAAPALEKRRLAPDRMRAIIVELCRRRYLGTTVLAQLLGRNADGLRDRFLTPMVREGLLVRRYPEEPNRPDQAYMTQQ